MECLLDIVLQRQSTPLFTLLRLILGDSALGLFITEQKRWALTLTLIWGMVATGNRKQAIKLRIHQLNIALLVSLLVKLPQTQLTDILHLWSRLNRTALSLFQNPMPKDLELFHTAHLIKRQPANLHT